MYGDFDHQDFAAEVDRLELDLADRQARERQQAPRYALGGTDGLRRAVAADRPQPKRHREDARRLPPERWRELDLAVAEPGAPVGAGAPEFAVDVLDRAGRRQAPRLGRERGVLLRIVRLALAPAAHRRKRRARTIDGPRRPVVVMAMPFGTLRQRWLRRFRSRVRGKPRSP
jgi:hypothetical protein